MRHLLIIIAVALLFGCNQSGPRSDPSTYTPGDTVYYRSGYWMVHAIVLKNDPRQGAMIVDQQRTTYPTYSGVVVISYEQVKTR